MLPMQQTTRTLKASLAFLLAAWPLAVRADLDDEIPSGKPTNSGQSTPTPTSDGKKDGKGGDVESKPSDASPSDPRQPDRPSDPTKPSEGTSTSPSGGAEGNKGKTAGSKPTGKKSSFSNFDSNLPIEYSSLGLKGNKLKGYFELIKDVRVKQGDMELFADLAKAMLDETGEEINQVLAEGNVRVKKVDPQTGKLMNAQAQKAIYYRLANSIEFRGDARLARGNEVIEGETIIYNLLTGDLEIIRPKGSLSDKQLQPVSTPKKNPGK